MEWLFTEQRASLWKYFEGAGALMTADGTGDDLIRLEGVKDDFKYEFMHVELVGDDESDAGSDAEIEEVPPQADADINDALDGECPPLSR